jgi:hypothetical protein
MCINSETEESGGVRMKKVVFAVLFRSESGKEIVKGEDGFKMENNNFITNAVFVCQHSISKGENRTTIVLPETNGRIRGA